MAGEEMGQGEGEGEGRGVGGRNHPVVQLTVWFPNCITNLIFEKMK